MCMEAKPMTKMKFGMTVAGYLAKTFGTITANIIIFIIGILVGMGALSIHIHNRTKNDTNYGLVMKLENITQQLEQFKRAIETNQLHTYGKPQPADKK